MVANIHIHVIQFSWLEPQLSRYFTKLNTGYSGGSVLGTIMQITGRYWENILQTLCSAVWDSFCGHAVWSSFWGVLCMLFMCVFMFLLFICAVFSDV